MADSTDNSMAKTKKKSGATLWSSHLYSMGISIPFLEAFSRCFGLQHLLVADCFYSGDYADLRPSR